MRFILLIMCFLLPSNDIFSQVLKFSESTWDFGTISEEGGEVTHVFDFISCKFACLKPANLRVYNVRKYRSFFSCKFASLKLEKILSLKFGNLSPLPACFLFILSHSGPNTLW